MKTEEKITNKKRLFRILIALILIVCLIILSQFAWARYVTSLNGNSKADIAKWSLVVNGNTSKSFTIKLAETRSGTQEAEVQSGYIGPGTSGKFEIEVDATDSEVSLKYSINMEVNYTNNNIFPKNLIFYSDPEMKNAIYHTDNSIILNGYIAQNAENKKIPHTIYWKWDFETGQTQEDKDTNDIADSYWIGQNISIPITVVGEQVNQNPTTNQYKVTFDANGGIIEGYGNSKIATKMVNNNEQFGSLPTPNREGYTFVGWSRNLADEISENNYSIYHYNQARDDARTTSEIRNNGEFGGLTNQNYFRIYGNEHEVDTSWVIDSKNYYKVNAGENFVFSFYARSLNAWETQFINNTTETSGSAGWYFIQWDNGERTYMQESATFPNDGNWYLITNNITVPENVTGGKIYLGTDLPNLYGTDSYIDIANIQFAKDSSTTPYYITSDTIFNSQSNITLYAHWIPNNE